MARILRMAPYLWLVTVAAWFGVTITHLPFLNPQFTLTVKLFSLGFAAFWTAIATLVQIKRNSNAL